ncbi:hypothetical protein DPMN_115007 [Dreissena polymorpha]|uniref:Uncharacterized protein n=1 Tax=Dreissena polymorpha TaxID=45954 RepID=A0A9D4KM21_DREPO|nr:hypothetical protein DPMN_115007 [Dreissena polymorpha]
MKMMMNIIEVTIVMKMIKVTMVKMIEMMMKLIEAMMVFTRTGLEMKIIIITNSMTH